MTPRLVKLHTSKTNANKWRSLYECRCGTQFEAIDSQVKSGRTTSCGCWQRSRGAANGRASAKHNAVGTLTYKAWSNMRARCYCTSNGMYPWYGAKGIKVCERWQDFNNFLADMGERPDASHAIGRIDHAKDYAPGNCEWQEKRANDLENGKRNGRRAALTRYRRAA